MTSSDIIAVIAVVVSALVLIVSVYIGYQTNKVNIEAKRSDLVFERRLEIFRELVEKIGLIKYYVINNLDFKGEKPPKSFFVGLNERRDDLFVSVQKIKVFIPGEMENHINNYDRRLRMFIKKEGYDNIERSFTDVYKFEKTLVNEIQKYIGL